MDSLYLLVIQMSGKTKRTLNNFSWFHNNSLIIREGAFAVGAGARFTNELYEIRIPDNLDVYTCDIGTFTIWCRQFTQWFTRLEFDTDLFVS